MKVFDVEKFKDFLYELIESNDENIENDNDGDGLCKFENEVLYSIITFMKDGKFYTLDWRNT